MRRPDVVATPEAIRARLRRVVARQGHAWTALALGVGDTTLEKILGAGVQQKTWNRVAEKLGVVLDQTERTEGR